METGPYANSKVCSGSSVVVTGVDVTSRSLEEGHCRSAMATGSHLLVILYPARGHSLPTIQLARKFVPHGVRITIADIFSAMAPELLDICRAEDIPVVNLGVRPARPGPSTFPFLADVESVQGEAEQLIAKQSTPVTCILSDIFLGWTQDVADKFNIPRYVLCTSSAKVLAVLLYTPELAAQGVLPVEASQDSQLVEIPGLLPTEKANLSPSVQTQFGLQLFAQYVYRCCQPAVERAAGYFVNSFEGLEPFCVDALRSYPYRQRAPSQGPSLRSVFLVGPLVHDALAESLQNDSSRSIQGFIETEAPYLRWLDRQSTGSVLYVSFGSLAALPIGQIHELALGLEASKQPFLLVVRAKDRGARPLLPEGFTAHARGVAFVEPRWVNQVDVLLHPAVGGFLTHCGWSSTVESMYRGIALLAWPLQADQKHNCRFLVDEAHAAIEVHKGADAFVTREEVVRAVHALMVEPEGQIVRANMRKLRDKVKEAISKDGSVQRSIESFIAELTSPNVPSVIS